ncbi:klaroid protein-like isoform X2 [Linepithema humile]|nr:PREDICTED: SUN domain-containing protein 1-like isoform X3 [Linepithema humile]XP_012235982.1 PREDICTED: SUN domain-containing protein 1-like isoform X3 [Linepithema humile]XP_012235983.1 PREDICTED: SUN domain-containing protein 1-like isoform X3 [Linepithema humile]
MEGEQRHYELRSRSRSRSHTPMVPSHPLVELEVTEHHYDLRNKSRERSHTPGEVTSSRRSGSRSLTGTNVKMHDKSMGIIEESKEGSVTGSITDNQSTKSESSIIITKKPERRSERQRAKRQIFANGQSESKEDTLDQSAERKSKSVTPRRILTSDYSSEEGEREDPPSRPGSAYEIYKQAGDWWNVFPKTDYTYSQASKCRYEIAPGVLAMPNMSRRSLHADNNGSTIPQVSYQKSSETSRGTTESGISDMDTVDFKETGSLIDSFGDMPCSYKSNSAAKSTVYKRTHIEQYTSHKVVYSDPGYSSDFQTKYFSWWTPSRVTEKYASRADSDTELDETFTASKLSSVPTNRRWKIVQWFTYLTTFIAIWFRKTIDFFKFRTDRRRQYYSAQAYQYYNESESKWSALWQALDRYTHNTYFFFVRILVLDAWLLSRFTGVRNRLRENGPKILWITLLPLLLLFGAWCTAQCLSLLPGVKIVSDTATEKLLPHVQQWNSYKSGGEEKKLTYKEAPEENLVNKPDLVGRIEILENGQAYQMEYLMNITQALEDRKQNDADFRREYNDKITNVESKLDVTEVTNIMYNELKIIKHEFEKLRELYSELKSCCNKNAISVANQDIEKHVERILFNYLPPGISKEDLAKISRNLLASYNKEAQTVFNNDVSSANVHVSDEHMRKIVKEVLRIYDADKTGQVDYALESAGGQIISTRCTQKYDIKSRAFSLFGFTMYYESNNPRTVIQGNTIQPGICWAFQDFPGYLLIQLRSVVYVTGFTLEHVPRLNLPNENMSSAPKRFDVWGFISENDSKPVMFGDYEFTYSDESLQYFPVQNTEINKPYEYIELRIHSNHGQLDYTCLYRFRVHGRPI